ncbi:MAG: rhombosortase [Hahellaceae bacterium]|nr:rhombosortase [Hahellaceae bacterium]
MRRVPFSPLVLWLILLIPLLHSAYVPFLEYQREAILNGELWRLVTGHLTHLGWTHGLLNMGGLILITHLFSSCWPRGQLLSAVFFIACLCSLLLLVLSPSLAYYVGLSGVLHGLMAQALLTDRHYPAGLRAVVFFGLLAKVAWEQTPYYSDALMAALIHGPVAVQAHAAGVVSGILWALLINRRIVWSKFKSMVKN